MPNSLNNPIQHLGPALDDVAHSLRKAAKDAEGLSKDASEALTKAAADVTHAAEALRKHAAATSRNVVQKAAHEMQQHPIATLAAAITAAAALVRLIAAKPTKDV
jgi:ElaB/YqjD/DUF883 family membrane-anchored ribosome-binding protein